MNSLWSFGDSYAECYTRDYNNEQYLNIVANHLKLKHQAFGLSGTSISYSSFMLNKHRDNIKKDDYVIITLTNLFRHWFFKNRPKEAALNVNLHTDERTAIKYHTLYLNNELEYETALLDFLYNVNALGAKTIILYGFLDTYNFLTDKEYKFQNIHFANGLLDNVQRNEFKDDFYNKWVKVPIDKIGDSRLNHLMKSNHNILANKIIEYIIHDIKIDLNTDFKKEIIAFDTKSNFELFRHEFFNNDWMFGL